MGQDEATGRDGKYQAVELSSSVYIYIVKYNETNSDTRMTRKGSVTLIRQDLINER
jgi:hypothetical protein